MYDFSETDRRFQQDLIEPLNWILPCIFFYLFSVFSPDAFSFSSTASRLSTRYIATTVRGGMTLKVRKN